MIYNNNQNYWNELTIFNQKLLIKNQAYGIYLIISSSYKLNKNIKT